MKKTGKIIIKNDKGMRVAISFDVILFAQNNLILRREICTAINV